MVTEGPKVLKDGRAKVRASKTGGVERKGLKGKKIARGVEFQPET